MDKFRRNERMSAMIKMLSAEPGRMISLNRFCELFGAAKSTVSEDLDALRKVTREFDLGEIETVIGAAGGVVYHPRTRREASFQYIQELCLRLSGTERLLPGDFLYYSDILCTPEIVSRMGEILATEFEAEKADFVLTMETKGIPVAFATAHALGIPLVIARHSSKVYEGSAVNINYVSGSGSIETMSLSRRAVKGHQRLVPDLLLEGGDDTGSDVRRIGKDCIEVSCYVFEEVSPDALHGYVRFADQVPGILPADLKGFFRQIGERQEHFSE